MAEKILPKTLRLPKEWRQCLRCDKPMYTTKLWRLCETCRAKNKRVGDIFGTPDDGRKRSNKAG